MKKILFATLLGILLCIFVSANITVSAIDEELLNYESLIVGFEDTHYSPEDESTATQVIAVAVRLHGIYNGTGIEESYDKEKYLDYALENGIVYEGLFDDYERGATRAEAVFVINNAIPAELLNPQINEIPLIPDCDPSAGYYEPVMSFYKAGIVTGYDKYGAFRPGASITNKDFADLLQKLVNPTLRQSAEYEEYASDEAFYLIDDFLMSIAVRNIPNIGSGWRYDYTGSLKPGVEGAYTNVLEDTSITDNISISRQVFAQKDGTVVLEALLTASVNPNGITLTLDNSEDAPIVTLGVENDYVYLMAEGGSGKVVSTQTFAALSDGSTARVRIELDLDNGKAAAHVGGTLIGECKIVDGYEDIAKVTISTGIQEVTTLKVNNVHLYKNYKVNDVMRVENIGKAPFGYTTTGDITVRTINGSNNASTGDINSAKIVASAGKNSNAHKDFKEVGGLVKLEAYMLLPTEDDGAYFTASYKGYPVFKIETRDGKFFYGDTELYDFSANIWQNIHVEANTNTQSFLLRINGKEISDSLPFMNNVPAFDSLDIGITPDSGCTMWFDDVEVHEMFEYEDYVPVPQKLESDYYLSMSVCNLWRNGSHYGWEYILPHDDVTPYTGYYDEGNPEAMDWEIKFLAEHGISFYNMCWYAPACPQNNPIKKPRMVDAFHDGYFNAKYSDMLDFTIMFENASFKTAESYDSFLENVWPFWIEWYLKDDRYFTIDNKPFLVIYQYKNWIEMCYEKPVTDDMTTEEKNTIHANAITRANELFQKMEQDMKDIGYDGLILTFTNQGNTQIVADECNAIGAAGVFPYNWGTTACTLKAHKELVESRYTAASQYGIDLLAVAGIGFNHLGWKLVRESLMSDDEFNDLLYWFRDDYLKRYETKYANDPDNLWKSKFLQFATWNEYGEGHYLYPTTLNGYGYLDSIAEVFGKTEHDTSIDVMPTDAQKARINHLFPGYRHYIRRKYLINPNETFTPPDIVEKSYDFTQTNSIATLGLGFGGFSSKPQQVNKKEISKKWDSGSMSYVYTYEYSGEIQGVSSNSDPIMSWKLDTPINAKDYEYIYLKLGASIGSPGTIFFRTDAMTDFKQDYSLAFTLNEGTNEYYIPTNSNTLWDGTITHLRIDPGNIVGATISFYRLDLMNYSEEAKGLRIFIDNNEYKPVLNDEIRSYDRKEIYIAPTEEDHFYRQLHIVYDWHLNTKKLTLEAPDGTIIDFEIGSDTAYVNGKSHKLDKKVEFYDGCPVIPLLFILDNTGFDYIYDFTKNKLEITVLDKSMAVEDISNGNAENEHDLNAFYNYVGGTNLVQRAVDPADDSNHAWYVQAAEGKSWSYVRTDFKYEAGKTYTVDFDFKLDTLNTGSIVYDPLNVNVNPRYANTSQMETATSNHYDHNVSVGTANYSEGWKHFSYTFTVADDYVTTDLDGNPYQDTLTIYMDPVKITTANQYGINYYIDNFTVRSQVPPFKVYNGDAEADDYTGVFGGGSNVTIETETLDDGTQNRYWQAVSSTTTKESWTYFNQHTEFISGMTYYFEVDIKIGQNVLEQDVQTQVSINARYYDSLQAHFTSNPKEHAKALGMFTTGEDWKTCQGSFTISQGYADKESGYNPAIAFFADPAAPLDGSSTDKRAVTLMIDNFKVYSKKPDHFD